MMQSNLRRNPGRLFDVKAIACGPRHTSMHPSVSQENALPITTVGNVDLSSYHSEGTAHVEAEFIRGYM